MPAVARRAKPRGVSCTNAVPRSNGGGGALALTRDAYSAGRGGAPGGDCDAAGDGRGGVDGGGVEVGCSVVIVRRIGAGHGQEGNAA